MKSHLNRRQFLRHTTLGTTALWVASDQMGWGKVSPNERLNVGVVGVAGRGGENLSGVASENIVALCDVDGQRLDAALQKFPQAQKYTDFRRLLDRKDLDAVVISTPDHTHAAAVVSALRSGRHVYCEKPLTRTVSETRIVTEAAARSGLVTQIGTQIHAGNNYRRVVELVKRGAIGKVEEVHVWVSATYGNLEVPKESVPVPAYLDYEAWLGPVEFRPYSPEYLPFKWRNWWAFGGGALADFGCHYMDLPFWALDLKYPEVVEVLDGPVPHPELTPAWLIVRYEYPKRKAQPPVSLTWYHGGKQPWFLSAEQAKWKSGVLFIGEKGQLLADYNRHRLLPEKQFADFKAPAPFIPDSIGHHKEWIQACKTGGKTSCSFDYSGPLTETALLGNVAFRAGRRLEWDAKKLQARNCPEAEPFLQHRYRAGWKL